MKVKYRDQTESVVDKERGEKLADLLMSGDCPEYVKINDIVVRKDYIVKVEPGGYPEGDRISEDRRVPPPDHRGEYSPTKEVLRKRYSKLRKEII